jgi:hypothetical protein
MYTRRHTTVACGEDHVQRIKIRAFISIIMGNKTSGPIGVVQQEG